MPACENLFIASNCIVEQPSFKSFSLSSTRRLKERFQRIMCVMNISLDAIESLDWGMSKV